MLNLAVCSIFTAATLVVGTTFAAAATMSIQSAYAKKKGAPTTGTLLVKKVVVCGRALCAEPSSFTLTVTGNDPIPTSFQGSAGGTYVTLGPGTFSIDEPGISDSVGVGNGSCSGAVQPPIPSNITGTIATGQHLTCTITNFQR